MEHRPGKGEAPTSVVIRPAEEGDAGAIYRLNAEAFADSFLLFTIYQSPKSALYIRELIARGPQECGQALYVAVSNQAVVGYYQATQLRGQWFLSYIATEKEDSGRGVGNLLLSHFEATGRAKGCAELALDVFDNNTRARDWYLRHGYLIRERFFHLRISLSDVRGVGGGGLTWDHDDMQRTLQDEQARGFAKLPCFLGQKAISLGLIDGRVCKLLDWGGNDVSEAVMAIARSFGRDRRYLVISGLDRVPPGLMVERAEEVLRLVKAARGSVS